MLPVMGILKSVPTMAFVVLALIWMKKENAPILIGIVIGFPLFYDMVLGGITNADNNLLRMMKIYGVKKKKISFYVYLPSILFSIIPSLSSTLCLILKVVIAGELYGQPSYGIGAQINIEKLSLNTDAIIGWIIIVGIISIFIDFIVNIINKKFFMWKGIE